MFHLNSSDFVDLKRKIVFVEIVMAGFVFAWNMSFLCEMIHNLVKSSSHCPHADFESSPWIWNVVNHLRNRKSFVSVSHSGLTRFVAGIEEKDFHFDFLWLELPTFRIYAKPLSIIAKLFIYYERLERK